MSRDNKLFQVIVFFGYLLFLIALTAIFGYLLGASLH